MESKSHIISLVTLNVTLKKGEQHYANTCLLFIPSGVVRLGIILKEFKTLTIRCFKLLFLINTISKIYKVLFKLKIILTLS